MTSRGAGTDARDPEKAQPPGSAYPSLRGLKVGDATHAGLISCSLETPLRTVARMMATYRVHAILVVAHGEEEVAGGRPWGIVSDLDLLQAADAHDVADLPARDVARTPIVLVEGEHGLGHAARLMAEHRVSHLVVVEPHSGAPFGVISTLDVARALAGFPERHPAR